MVDDDAYRRLQFALEIQHFLLEKLENSTADSADAATEGVEENEGANKVLRQLNRKEILLVASLLSDTA